MENVLEYRINGHEKQIDFLTNHAQEVNTSLLKLSQGLEITNDNIKETFEKIVVLADRLKILETESTEKTIKKKIVGDLHAKVKTFWPYVLCAIVILSTFDFNRLITFIKTLKG